MATGEVETDRLRLRPFMAGDLEALSAIFVKPEVWRYPFGRGLSRSETESFLERRLDEWDERGWSLWAAVRKDQRRLIGYAGLSVPTFLPEVMPAVEVGWRLDPDHWGHGFATEAGAAALRFGFEVLGLAEIVSIYEPANTASGAVMRRLGMRHDRDTMHPEQHVPVRVYRLAASEWRAAGAAGPVA